VAFSEPLEVELEVLELTVPGSLGAEKIVVNGSG